MIDRSTDGFGEWRMPWRGVVEWCGNAVLYIHGVVMAQSIQLGCGYAGFNEGFNVIQHLGGKTANLAHLDDVVRGFNGNGHEKSAGGDKADHFNRSRPGFARYAPYYRCRLFDCGRIAWDEVIAS